jgi:hypothetical protein
LRHRRRLIDKGVKGCGDELESYEGHWIIRMLGSQQNTIWQLTVESSDGKREWVTKLYAEDGGHTIDNILIDLRRIVEGR